MGALLQPAGRVLSTLNPDGSRRQVRPRRQAGPYFGRRRAVAWVLMAMFVAIPHLRVDGLPLLLLDIPRRRFTVFGTTFLPTDTLLFMLLFISVVILIMLVTAVLGRAWCGWACPQTVYMEFLFRPIEYWIEGGRAGTLALDRARGWKPRRVLKNIVFALLALLLAHTFLAYFAGVDQLAHWIQSPPSEHPTAFFVMVLTAGLMIFDFAWFREQTCLVACPYGRLQAALLDRHSLIVGYDVARGEPRGRKSLPIAPTGDCIDCSACVQVCPTGIDIRDGLQMECIHCTQCADACDAIMDRIGRPRGLVRYTSRARLEGAKPRWIRARVIAYPVALAVALGLLVFFVGARRDTEITVLRGTGSPWSLQGDRVVNQVRVRVDNHAAAARAFSIRVADSAAVVVAPENPLLVPAGGSRTTSIFIGFPRGAFHDGERHVRVVVAEGAFRDERAFTLLGPREEEDDER